MVKISNQEIKTMNNFKNCMHFIFFLTEHNYIFCIINNNNNQDYIVINHNFSKKRKIFFTSIPYFTDLIIIKEVKKRKET